MTTVSCLDCAFRGAPEQIREHRAARHAKRVPRRRPAALPDGAALLTPTEVAALFRVDPKTVSRWSRKGRLPCIRTLGGHRRFRAADVRALLEEDGR